MSVDTMGDMLGGLIGPEAMAALRNIQNLASVVQHIADVTGDGRALRAAGQLRVKAAVDGGRPTCDDQAALASMKAMLDRCEFGSVAEAARAVARATAATHRITSLYATQKRLSRKYLAQNSIKYPQKP